MLGIVTLYAVSIAGTIALLFFWLASRRGSSYPRLRCWTLRHIVYPLLPSLSRTVYPLFPSLIRRRRWTSVTRIDFILLAVYVAVNAFCSGFGIGSLDERGTSALMRRSGLLSSVNMVLLFLGGRTNALIDAFDIPLHTYYLAHHWVGRLVVAQALLHAGLATASRRWIWDAQSISGVVVATALALIFSTSLSFIRGLVFELFLITHVLLALTVIGGTVWHILPGEFTLTLLLPVISISVWSISTLYRLVRIRRNRDRYIISYDIFARPGQADPRLCAVKLTIRVPQHLDARPGYLYLYFTGLRWRYRFQAHPFMIIWYEHGVEDQHGIDITDLTFLIQPRDGLTARLGRELRLNHFSSETVQSSVLFDGPYGQNFHLEEYETVVLVAKGIGIAGVLPYAQHLVQRSHHDAQTKKLLKLASTPNKDDLRKTLHRDTTRSVDLFWKLELNDQEKWVSEQLLTLQDLDPGRRTNLIYCYYPEKKTSEPLIKRDKGWKTIYPEDQDAELTLDEAIKLEAGKSRKTVVVACGNATFTQLIRKMVLGIMSKDNIVEFLEVEYRPSGIRNQDDAELESAMLLSKRQRTRVTRLPDDEIELARLPTRGGGNVLSKAPRAQVRGKVHGNDYIENAPKALEASFV
jgi:predicted ferric reductase